MVDGGEEFLLGQESAPCQLSGRHRTLALTDLMEHHDQPKNAIIQRGESTNKEKGDVQCVNPENSASHKDFRTTLVLRQWPTTFTLQQDKNL